LFLSNKTEAFNVLMNYNTFQMSIAVANRDETDEAFARRLYAQELGRGGNLDGARTPLMVSYLTT